MIGLSVVVLVPVLVTVVVVSLVVAFTVATVRAERRYNAVLAPRWVERQRQRRILATHWTASVRAARARANRDAA